MTTYLKQLGQALQVSLLYQGVAHTVPDSHRYMGVSPIVPMFVRHVILLSDAQPVLFAQCVMLEAMSQQHDSWLQQLGEYSIGEQLFQRPQLQRSNIEVAQLPVDSNYHRIMPAELAINHLPLWARRSQLYDDTIRVGVIEVCLPTLLNLKSAVGLTTRRLSV